MKLSITKAGFCPVLETENFKCAFIMIVVCRNA